MYEYIKGKFKVWSNILSRNSNDKNLQNKPIFLSQLITKLQLKN